MATKPSLQFSVMCLDLLEEERKPPTLQYLFYELPFPYLPFRMDKFHVINCWANGLGDHKQSVKILVPSKSKVLIETGEQTFTLEDSYTPQLMINVFADIEFQEQGHYWVQNYLNNELVLEYPLTVRMVETGAKPPSNHGPQEKKKEAPVSPSSPITMNEWNIPQ